MKDRYKVFIIQLMITCVSPKRIDHEPPDKNATIQSRDEKILIFDVVTFPNDPCFSPQLDRVSVFFQFLFVNPIPTGFLNGR